MQQLELMKVECPVFGSHRWMLDNHNKGMCKCGMTHDFTPALRKALPDEYNTKYASKLKIPLTDNEGEYYMQGSIRINPYRTIDED